MTPSKPKLVSYDPSRFDVTDMQTAKDIILTPTTTQTTDERWEHETKFLMDGIRATNIISLTANSVVIDYGVGIGRLAKEIIKEYNCQVIGVDISESMRRLSVEYVGSDKYLAIKPEEIHLAPKADLVLGIWIFQHIPRADLAIVDIRKAMKIGGKFMVVNDHSRCLPIKEDPQGSMYFQIPVDKVPDWADDYMDVKKYILQNFKFLVEDNHWLVDGFCSIFEKMS